MFGTKRIKSTKSEIKKAPQDAGIYVFWNKNVPIYIGKAINLRNRLESYFVSNLKPKTSQMVSLADAISYIKVPTEIEALLLEAELIWKHKPKFNRALKDDKHPLYIMITKDRYPRVIMAKRSEISTHLKVFGPFPSTGNMRAVLKMLRPIFPFSTHLPSKRTCLYHQLGLCKPCPSDLENEKDPNVRKEKIRLYRQNVRNINRVLSGKYKRVRTDLDRKMRRFSDLEKFEEAKAVKAQIDKLDYITTPMTPAGEFLKNPNLIEDLRTEELSKIKELLDRYFKITRIRRIECFDVAHLAGAANSASMVTFIDGSAEKEFYRHFRVKNAKGGDDTASLSEIAKRRFARLKDWGSPDLIIVDGGKAQVKVFHDVFSHLEIPVVGIAKRFETLIIPYREGKLVYSQVRLEGPALNLVTRIRDEAHRFARRYHHLKLKQALLKI